MREPQSHLESMIQAAQTLVDEQALDAQLWFGPHVALVRMALRELAERVEVISVAFESQLDVDA